MICLSYALSYFRNDKKKENILFQVYIIIKTSINL